MSVLGEVVPTSAETWIYQLLHISSVAALTFNTYDWLLTLGEEWKYIWRNQKLHVWIKTLFIVLRYFSLVAQLVHYIWGSGFMSIYPIQFLMCRNYQIFELLSLLIQLNAIDCLMILRVWLVFNQERKFLRILMAIFICQLSIIGVLIFRVLSQLRVDELCTPRIPLLTCLLFWLVGFIVHTTSWAFTMYQCHRARSRGIGRTPLIWLLERDGTCFWLSFVVLVTLNMIASYIISATLAPVVNLWIISSASVIGCRMILDVQHLAHEETGTTNIELSSSVVFTTNISPLMSSMIWSKVDGHLVDAFMNAQSLKFPVPKTDP